MIISWGVDPHKCINRVIGPLYDAIVTGGEL